MQDIEWIEALYRTLLGRPIDDQAAQHYGGRAIPAQDGDALISGMLESDEFAARFSEFARRFLKGRGKLINEQSQFGEVEWLIKAMVNEGAAHRQVVDVGARGVERSNSFDLITGFGWKGLLIEANPALIDDLQAALDGFPATIVSCAVSDFEGETELFLGVNADVSSLTASAAGEWGGLRGSVSVRVRRLAALLAEHGVPPDFDLLSLDIEGHDERVLNDLVLHSPYRPRWIVIEASHDFSVRDLAQTSLAPEVRAAYAMLGQTRANLILRRTERPA